MGYLSMEQQIVARISQVAYNGAQAAAELARQVEGLAWEGEVFENVEIEYSSYYDSYTIYAATAANRRRQVGYVAWRDLSEEWEWSVTLGGIPF